MYRLLRNTHLILGLLVSLFLLTYALSALQMAHRIKLTPSIVEQDVAVRSGMEGRALATLVMTERSIDGDLSTILATPTGSRFTVTRPGALWTITYEFATGHTHIHKEVRDFFGFLNRLHHLNGMRHESQSLNSWGLVLFFVSIALLALGGTGVYMWYRRSNERLIGSFLLATNLIFSAVIIALLRY